MTQVYKRLGEFLSKDEEKLARFGKVVITYKQPTSTDPGKEWNHSATVESLSDKALDLLDSLSAGERFCVHQSKDDKGYPIIVDISDAKDAEQAKSSGGGWKGGSKSFTPKDETGIAVGAAWNNAIELYGTYNKREDLEEIDGLAWDILQRKLAHEKRLRGDKQVSSVVNNATVQPKVEEKPKSAIELRREARAKESKPAEPVAEEYNDLVEDDDLNNIEF